MMLYCVDYKVITILYFFILLLKSAFFEFLTFMKGENKNRDATKIASLFLFIFFFPF